MAGELKKLVSDFAGIQGIEAPPVAADGTFRFTLDAQLELKLFQHGNELILEGDLGPVPEAEPEAEALLVRCLRQQLGRVLSHRASLVVDPESGSLTLARRALVRELDARQFGELLGEFANELEFWQLFVAPGEQRTVPTAVPAAMMMVRP